MRRVLLGVACFASVIASTAALASETPMEAAIASFDRLGASQTKLIIGSVASEQRQSRYLFPSWISDVGFTTQEASAVVAAVGAYGIDQHVYSQTAERRDTSIGEVLATLPLAMAASSARDNARRYRETNTLSQPNDRITTRTYGSTPEWPSQEAHFSSLLVKLDSCNGAFLSAINKLEDGHAEDRLTDFMQSIRRDMSVQTLRLDPECSG